MATQDNNDFDEAEWKAGADGGPSFEFEEGDAKPDFEPTDFSEEPNEENEFERMWRDAEPAGEKRQHQADAQYPGMPSEEERQWAMIAHAAGAVSLFVTGGTAGWLVPLIIWIVRKEKDDFAAEQAREALNFHLTAFLISLLALPLVCLAGFGLLILFAIPICTFVYSIIGAMKTYNGERYDYPINFRMI